jgi:short-subunit dehydrogenase
VSLSSGIKRIIIIGASSGIGKELALQYAAQGHLVGITGRRRELLEEVQQAYPDNIHFSAFDVTGNENENHLHQLINDLGGLDLLIYNAGFGEPSSEYNMKAELASTKINVVGCVEIVGSVFQYFLQKGYGHIAITSSVAGMRGNSWAPAYSASKSFLINYAESLNIKARRMKKNIHVTDIRPGFVDTKAAKGNARFWVASPQVAAKQIIEAIAAKKRVAYITRRWWLIGQVVKLVPYWLYSRIV